MDDIIYVRLLNEGVEVYRPVTATLAATNVSILGGEDFYDPDDEEWEFLPGMRIAVAEKVLDGKVVLVAENLS